MVKYIHTQQHQFEILVDFMLAHPEMSKKTRPRNATHRLWKKLAFNLNAVGPPTRLVDGWKKVWADYKNHIKIKMRRNRASISESDGPSKYFPLTPLEEKVNCFLNLENAISGAGESVAVQNSSAQLSPVLLEYNSSDEYQSDTISVITESQDKENHAFRDRMRTSPHREERLFQAEVENQINNYQNSLKWLEDITENLKDISKCMKRAHELEEKTHKLAIEKFEHKKRRDIEKRKQKIAELKLKKHIILTLGL